MPALPDRHNNQGQMLLSMIIAIAIFSILLHALFTLIASSFDLISFNKTRITARHLAQQRVELIRNLPYDEVATIGGIPNGTLISQNESVEKNGLKYTLKTDIVFIDDPYDSLAPEDSSPEDYKRVRVEVSWEGLATSRKNPVVLLSDISALTTGNLEGGTLIIQVSDANGNPVPQADVTIIADSIIPPVNLTQSTDSEGKVTLPGATDCVECYQISVTNEGISGKMSTDKTYSTSEVTNPIKPHASVFSDQVTQLSFAIDTVGDLNITSLNSRENNFAPLGNVSFRLHGNKIIGTDAYAQPVYKFDEILTTDGTGSINISEMEWDVYHVVMPSTTTNDVSATEPLLPLNLPPAGNLNFSFAVSPHSDHGFFLRVIDNSQNLIATASAKLYDDLGFEETKYTGEMGNPDQGQVLFSNLIEEIYHLTVSVDGFANYTNDYSISGYTQADVVLTPF